METRKVRLNDANKFNSNCCMRFRPVAKTSANADAVIDLNYVRVKLRGNEQG